MFARESYWCIAETLKQAGLKTYPYHVYVPSFGEWGFVLAGHATISCPTSFLAACDSSVSPACPRCSSFLLTCRRCRCQPNRLNSQVLVRAYERDWKDISH